MSLNGHLQPGDWALTFSSKVFATLDEALSFTEFGYMELGVPYRFKTVPEGSHCLVLASKPCGSNGEGRMYLALVTAAGVEPVLGWISPLQLWCASREPPT